MLLQKLVQSVTRRLGRLLSFDQAVLVSRTLLEEQGFGGGADVKSSGELAVFKLLNGPAPVLFDVGGHIGEYAEGFLRAHPHGRAFVFEPFWLASTTNTDTGAWTDKEVQRDGSNRAKGVSDRVPIPHSNPKAVGVA